MEILQEKIIKTEITANGTVNILKQLFVRENDEIKQKKWRCVCIPSEDGKAVLRKHLVTEQAEAIISGIWTDEVMVNHEQEEA